MKKNNLYSVSLLVVFMFAGIMGFSQNTYNLVTSAAQLEAGAKYLIAADYEGECYVMGMQRTSNRLALLKTETDGSIVTTIATVNTSEVEVFEFELGGSAGAWTLYDPLNSGYLYASSSTSNQLKTQTTNDANGEWAIVIDTDGSAVVTAQGANTRNIMRFNYNSGNPALFGCYGEGSSVNTPVRFYKESGTTTIYPEPSEYPTDFAAQATYFDVKLTWTDAVGSQLPAGYLVLGNAGAIAPPTDGTPVQNNVNPAAGQLAMNVPYGVKTVTFGQLASNTTYNFAIFPYTNSGANIDYKTSATYPTASATISDITMLLNESFDGDLGDFTVFDVYGDQTWEASSYGGTTYAKMSGYADGSAHENEDWLISPALAGNYQAVRLSFQTAMKFDGDPLQIMVSSDYDGQSEPSEYTWTNLTDMFDWSTGNYEWISSGVVNVKNFVSDRFYIAFVYTSNATNASTWEVTDVLVFGEGVASVSEQQSDVVALYPNPGNGLMNFNLDNDAEISVYDINGRLVAQRSATQGNVVVNINDVENGVYFVNLKYVDGTIKVAKYVKM